MWAALKLAHSGEGCLHHYNQFRLRKLQPRLLDLHSRHGLNRPEKEKGTEKKVTERFIGKEK